MASSDADPANQELHLNAQVIDLSYLPTSDPAVAGQLWVDSSAGYAIKQSQG